MNDLLILNIQTSKQLIVNSFPNPWDKQQQTDSMTTARSPNTNPLDFFIWDFVKQKRYATPPANEQCMISQINTIVQLATPDMLGCVFKSLSRRL